LGITGNELGNAVDVFNGLQCPSYFNHLASLALASSVE
jgi:hypothetical protein